MPRRRRFVVAPLGAAIVVILPGVLGVLMHQLWLFPSLGPTALMQVHVPEHASARPYNVIVGHFCGVACGLLAVSVFGLAHTPSIYALHALDWRRVGAAALAVGLATVLELVLHAPHPPAAASTLLVALGSFRPTMTDVGDIVIGVLVVAAAGEVLRRMMHDPPPDPVATEAPNL
jgi:hypothetical protein